MASRVTDPASVPTDSGRESLASAAAPRDEHRQEYQQALLAWLRWNDAYERVTAVMYQAGQDQARLQEFMDQMDQLRAEAISLSRKLLD